MNTTNRGVNRSVLAVVGLLLISAGGVTLTAKLWSTAGDIWKQWGETAVQWMKQMEDSTRLSEATSMSWFALAILALLLLSVMIAVTIVMRMGGGRSTVVIREEASDDLQGAVTIQHGFASDAITHSLRSHDEILSSKVTVRRVQQADLLHVSVTPRQHVSPADVADTVTGFLDRFTALLGQNIPALVTIRSGVRSKLAAEQPRVN